MCILTGKFTTTHPQLVDFSTYIPSIVDFSEVLESISKITSENPPRAPSQLANPAWL